MNRKKMETNNLKKKDLLGIVADSARTELETALAAKCLRLEERLGQLNAAVNDYFQCMYSIDRFLGKFKQKHNLGDKFRSKSLANEVGNLRARLKAGGLSAHASAKTIKECK